ncbi:TolB family protein [Microbulbifer sp. TYP-18]|uniref:TolB family protein n=1 Tax=Microbulbifer sp. TYP-18 TaxID=3230024 RepID=UPI0034C635F1
MSYKTPFQNWPTGAWPSYSTDGSQIVFTDSGQLWIVATPTKSNPHPTATALTSLSGVNASRPDWSWNPNWIAFSGTAGGESYLYIVSPSDPANQVYRLNVVDIVSGDPYTQILYPSWYENQGIFALAAVNYTKTASGPAPVILVIDLSDYSPGSTDPVYAGAVTDASQVYAGRPTVSPDGSQIAFAGNQGSFNQQHNQIWIVEPDSPSGPIQLDPDQGRSPNWSPDGASIVFESNRGGSSYQVFLIPASGGVVTPLTDPSYDANHPEWSRDGTSIVFNSLGGGIYSFEAP